MATDDQQRPTGPGPINGTWMTTQEPLNELIEVSGDILKVDATQAQVVPPTHRQEEQQPTSIATTDLTIYHNLLSNTFSRMAKCRGASLHHPVRDSYTWMFTKKRQ